MHQLFAINALLFIQCRFWSHTLSVHRWWLVTGRCPKTETKITEFFFWHGLHRTEPYNNNNHYLNVSGKGKLCFYCYLHWYINLILICLFSFVSGELHLLINSDNFHPIQWVEITQSIDEAIIIILLSAMNIISLFDWMKF